MRFIQKKELVLGPGKVIFNYGTNDALDAGRTRGGGSYTVAFEYRHIAPDGAKGPIAKLKHLIRTSAALETTLLEGTPETRQKMFPGVHVSTEKNYTTIQDNFKLGYIDNVVYLCAYKGKTNPIRLWLYNACVTSSFNISMVVDKEVPWPITFEASFHADDNPEESPFKAEHVRDTQWTKTRILL